MMVGAGRAQARAVTADFVRFIQLLGGACISQDSLKLGPRVLCLNIRIRVVSRRNKFTRIEREKDSMQRIT
jgi:hypothetical protein